MAIRDAKVRITAEDKTRAAFDSAKRNVEGFSSSLLGVRSSLTALLGTAGFGALIKSVADTGDQIQKLQLSLGASTEAFSEYRLIAERSGTTIETLSLIWQRQTRRVAEAAAGTGEARAALRELGLEAESLNRLSPDRQFEAIAEAMGGVENQADKLRLAFKLFDSEGARPALQAMAEGAEGLRAMRLEANAMGLTLNQVQADQMAAFNDELTNAKLAITGAAQSVVVALGPTIIELARGFATATRELSKFIDGLRGIEDRSNLEGLREEMTDLTNRALALNQQIEQIENAGGDSSGLKKRYEDTRAELDRVIARLRELQTQQEQADIAGFSVTPGSPLASIEDEKAAEKAEARAQREAERLAAQQEQRLAQILEYTQTEQEALQAAYDERILFLEEAFQNELISEQAKNDAKLLLESDYQQKRAKIEAKGLTDRQKFERKTQLQQAKDISSHLTSILGTVANHNKTLFEINKIAAISEAIINTYEGVSETLSKYPWPLAGVMAAAHLAAGLAQISTIQSTSFGDRGGAAATSPGGSVPTYTTDPVFGLPTQQTTQPVAQEINITLGDDAGVLPTATVRNLIEQINEQIEDGVVISGIRVS